MKKNKHCIGVCRSFGYNITAVIMEYIMEYEMSIFVTLFLFGSYGLNYRVWFSKMVESLE